MNSRGPSPAATATLVAALVLGSCGAPQPTEDAALLSSLYDRLVVDADRLVLPSGRWRKGPCGEDWGFERRASFWVWLAPDAEALAPPLAIELEASGGGELPALDLLWNGERLPPTNWIPGGKGGSVLIESERVEPGLHRLELRIAKNETTTTVCASGLRWQQGELGGGMPIANRERFDQLIDFLTRGVAGDDLQRLGGTLFLGPGRLVEPVYLEAAGGLRFDLENDSRELAVFRVRVGNGDASLQLGPGRRGLLEVWVEPGATEVELETTGDPSGLFLWGAPRLAPVGPDERTPVILVTLDTTRRDALSIYGHPANTSPRLDELAEHATVFERATATSPWTLPSHASLFTGLYPSRHGAGVSEDRLPSEFPTVAERFRDAGYFTAGYAGGWMAGSTYGLAQGFGHYLDPDGQRPGDELAERAVELIREHRTTPLFLFLNFFDAHAHYTPAEPWASRFDVPELRQRLRDPLFRRSAEADDRAWARVINGESDFGEPELAWLDAAYHAEVAFADEQLGRVLDVLRELDLYDRALIVITSDHGEFLGEQGFFSHGSRLEPELIDVPLVIKWPYQREGRRSSVPVSLVDLYATLLATIEPGVDPRDGVLLNADGSTLPPREPPEVLFEEHESVVHMLFPYMSPAPHLWGREGESRRDMVARRGGLCSKRVGAEWQETPCDPPHEELLAEILGRLGVELEAPPEPVDAALTPEEREQLEALGYLPPSE